MTFRLIDSKPVEFVNYTPSEAKKEKEPYDVARVHAAKVGWLKSAKAAEIQARRRKSEGSGRRSWRKKGAAADNVVTPHWSQTVTCAGDSAAVSDAGIADPLRGNNRSPATQDTEVTVVPRTISPTFGASSFETFDASHDLMGSQNSVMLSNIIWPATAGAAISMPWFQDFCTSPVLYHAHCSAGATYRDLLANNFLWTGSKTTLVHKANAMSLIQEQFARLDTMSGNDIEKLILAIMVLGAHDLEPKHLVEMELPFNPHIPTANMLRLWGRLDPVMAHQNATFALIDRQGGLDYLDTPGLGFICALVDLLRAGSLMHKPVFPCYWPEHVVDILPEDIDEEEFLTSPRRPGVGFFKLPSGLPHLAASVLAEVACLDRIMGTFRERIPSGEELETLLDTRSATLHRLFSLPSWTELAVEEKQSCRQSIYEACRITAVIYCNAVVFPIPPHNRWNDRSTAMLVEILTLAELEAIGEDASELHVWTLMIGGMAAQGTAQQVFFEDALRRWYAGHRQSWSAILTSLKTFIWSDHACKAGGAALLHRALFRAKSRETG